jgi:hypothetical protein
LASSEGGGGRLALGGHLGGRIGLGCAAGQADGGGGLENAPARWAGGLVVVLHELLLWRHTLPRNDDYLCFFPDGKGKTASIRPVSNAGR